MPDDEVKAQQEPDHGGSKPVTDTHDHDHDGDHSHDETHSHDHDGEHSHDHADDDGHDHADGHDHDHADEHDHDHDGEHSHDHADGHNHDGDHSHDHDNGHSHGDGHGHSHEHEGGVIGTIKSIMHIGHSHDHGELASDKAFSDNKLGIRTVWLALFALGITSILQIVIVVLSGSVALFADTVHNVGDALNSIPLLIAFYLARRLANRRYTFGYARAEDVAGIFIVLSIAFSAAIVIWESIQRLFNPEPMTNLGWVAAAAIIGFVGNEVVAVLQIRVGKRIGSAALVADGLHAQIDGLTSLSVLIAVFGTFIGVPILDPIIGLLIGIAILFIVKDATVRMWYRLMDAIEPEIMDTAEAVIKAQPDVREFRRVRIRWMGHRLQAEVYIAVDADLTTAEGHEIAEGIRYDLFHELPRLSDVVVHIDPWPELPEGHHKRTMDYEPIPENL